MFSADPTLQEPFLRDEFVKYKRVAQLIPMDMPLVMVAPTFISTPNSTTKLADIMPITPQDQTNRQKLLRYDAYVNPVWVDAPTVVVSMITNSAYRPLRNYFQANVSCLLSNNGVTPIFSTSKAIWEYDTGNIEFKHTHTECS